VVLFLLSRLTGREMPLIAEQSTREECRFGFANGGV